MASGPFSTGMQAAYVEQGRILDVNASEFTVSVSTMFSRKPQTGITWMSPYQHFANGEGFHVLPEVGGMCWIMWPSDGNRAFVLGWCPASDEDGDWQSRRPEMNPGDMYLGTRDENHVFLKRGGVIQISSTPLCTRLFLPLDNTIRDFCENYALNTLGGDLTWSVVPWVPDKGGDAGARPATLRLAAREFANDENPIAVLEVGSHDGDPNAILSLNILADGTKAAAWKVKLLIGKDGTVTWSVVKDGTWKITGEGAVVIDVKDNVSISTGKKLVLGADDEATLKATNKVGVASNGTVEVNAALGMSIDGPPAKALTVSGGTIPVLLATPQLLAWLGTHMHPTAALGPPSPPILPTPLAGIGIDHISKSIFAK